MKAKLIFDDDRFMQIAPLTLSTTVASEEAAQDWAERRIKAFGLIYGPARLELSEDDPNEKPSGAGPRSLQGCD